jgi:uncharacterized repeat protein (TIGR04076 family)
MNKCAYLTIQVVDLQGTCPVYHVGDSFCIQDGYQLVSDRPICLHALQSLNPYYVPLSRGIAPSELGLAGPDGAAFVQCLDPQKYTGGGTVTFRIGVQTDRRNGGAGAESEEPNAH